MRSIPSFDTEDLIDIFFQRYMEDEKGYSVSLDNEFLVEVNKKHKASFTIKDLQATFKVCINQGLITHRFLSNPSFTGMELTKEGIITGSRIHKERKKTETSDFMQKISIFVEERKGFFSLVVVITTIATFLVSYFTFFK